MPTKKALLLVEDNEDDIFLMQRALEDAGVKNPLFVVEDGQEAMDYLSGAGKFSDRTQFPLPALMFLDLKLPLRSGHDVLAWLRKQEELKTIVVVVLTSSEEPSDIRKSYQLGANSFLIKPPTADELLKMAKAFRWYWLDYNQYQDAAH